MSGGREQRTSDSERPGSPRTCGPAIAGLALLGAWALLQVVIDLSGVTGGSAVWAVVLGLSLALPAAGAGASAVALSQIEQSGGTLSGRRLVIPAIGLGGAVAAIETLRGRPITMLGAVVAAIVWPVAYAEANRAAAGRRER